ncbi:HAMP domain-containing sensor histidine kinase [Alteromonas sp. 1_MG-2023]|uniref:sensor histidine kinase n=1 Tax=Alteromonas sp. 1_MG-2023 TaxID=3062669 RepID=UPI0026E1E070|nr:HAMP domain-containing sensor histidine kinase [Alteromonas sp. 1_MG-2023]MDO6477897.1 HAMP domain-containing sensor histidine kinase [Alteromonas sp. 1_MG-2023]
MSEKSPLQTIDFSSVLAAAVHDMKNSLCLLIQSIESLAENLPPENSQANEKVASVHYEATRLNTNLVQILSLYRAELNQLPVTIDECFIDDLFEDVMSSVRIYMGQKNLLVTINVENDISWYLDRELIFMLINDVLINAMRYGTSQIILNAAVRDETLVITVEDDGPGYPSSMLEKSTADLAGFDLSQGRTGLGLFFARLIANAHVNNNHCGEISLNNGGTLGGSVFEVKLP